MQHPKPKPSLRTSISLVVCVCAAISQFSIFNSQPAFASSSTNWRQWLSQPDPAYSQIPFWFWNDELDDEEIRRQMADFRAKGVHGFVIHARMGLPKSIPYMGERWLAHVKFAVEEAARTGMRVCLYDEGMYPSGSAHGEVVRANPAHAAQALAVSFTDVNGPASLPRPAAEGRLVATVVARVEKDVLDGSTLRMIEPPDREIALPAGRWRVMTFSQVPSGGHIRGVHEDEEGGRPNAPPAADLLNPEAMRAFLRFAYEPYARTVGEHFGKTVIAMFTDEPSLLGRGPRRGVKPWTTGLEDEFARRRGHSLLPLLPALFFDCGERTARVRADFERTLSELLNETYYAQLSRWCSDHGLALTGHPAGSDEILPLRHFHIPGQDLVWRYVVPGDSSTLEGAHSTTAKCSSSVARHDGRTRNANEVYGAYGWDLSMEEMKWLADWLCVRGVNLLMPHAFYYSIRGERVQERPPDVGPNNAWWLHYRTFADYTSRLCRLAAEGTQVCDVAVLSFDNRLPWASAKWLFQHQVDFNYVEDWRLLKQARIEGNALRVGDMRYTTLVVEHDAPLEQALRERVDAFASAGGTVLQWDSRTTGLSIANRPLHVEPAAPDLRIAHFVRDGHHFCLLVNEGERLIPTTLAVPARGPSNWFDAWTTEFTPATPVAVTDAGMQFAIRLERRSSLVLCIEPGEPAPPRAVPPAPRVESITLADDWLMTRPHSGFPDKPLGDVLGNWLEAPPTVDYAGTIIYHTSVQASPQPAHRYVLDLGHVGDWADLAINGKRFPPQFWAPYAWDVTEALRTGANAIEVRVTNSLAVAHAPDKARSSGLIGPVRLLTVPTGP